MFNEEQLRATILRKLHQWVNAMPDPDRPFVGFAGSGITLSPKQIVEQVEQGTPRGERFVQNWMRLAIDHIMESSLVRSTHDVRGSTGTTGSAMAQVSMIDMKDEKAIENKSTTAKLRSEAQ